MTTEALKSAFEIRDALIKLGVPENAIRLEDVSFVLPSEDFICGKLARMVNEEWQSATGRFGGPEAYDCDNIALAAMHIAQLSHAEAQRQSKNPIAAGIAFGRIAISAIEHEVNWSAQEDEVGNILIKLWEPQVSMAPVEPKPEWWKTVTNAEAN